MKERERVYGVGINDADYAVMQRIDGKQTACPYYMKWHSMLRRCYCEKSLREKPTYRGCKVSPEWHRFSTFKSWMQCQEWQDKELDKDLLGDGKLYSSATCVFVPKSLNAFTNCNGATRGSSPLGVRIKRGRFTAQINIGNRKVKHLGVFETALEAHLAWAQAKAALAIEWIARMIDQRIKDGLQRFIVKLIENSMLVN